MEKQGGWRKEEEEGRRIVFLSIPSMSVDAESYLQNTSLIMVEEIDWSLIATSQASQVCAPTETFLECDSAQPWLAFLLLSHNLYLFISRDI